jgi:DinB superfamily
VDTLQSNLECYVRTGDRKRLAESIVESIQLKLLEQIERTEHLIRLVPPDKLGWDPQLHQGSSDVGYLLGHLLDCMAGVCAVFHAAFPQQLGDFSALQSLPVNHFCTPEETLRRIREYTARIGDGFDLCRDNDLVRMVPSVFVPQGEPLATLLLGNLEHLINHKYQLFFYLKLLGIPVTSRDIYRWRGTAAQ